jgi:hypothetical protein
MIVVPQTFEEFLKQAGKKLDISAKYAYTSTGGVIDDTNLLREDEDVYISEKSGFYRNGIFSSHIHLDKLLIRIASTANLLNHEFSSF